MKWLIILLALGAIAASSDGCGPTVVVENKTKIPVRVVVTTADGSEVVSPSPGESSTVDASEGSYRAVAIPDADWIEYAKLTRKVLNDQIANSENLSGPQLLEVVRRLKEIAERMDQFTKAAGTSAGCGGSVTSDSTGIVTVSAGPDGKLAVSCK